MAQLSQQFNAFNKTILLGENCNVLDLEYANLLLRLI